MSNKLIIFGAGGFGREVLALIERDYPNYDILGFIDDNAEIGKKVIGNYAVIGNVDYLLNFDYVINVVICIASPHIRERIVNKLILNEKIMFPTIISKYCINYSKYNSIGKGCIICDNTVLTVNVCISNFVIINLSCTIGHEATLHEYVTLYPAVNVSGNVCVNSKCEVGTGTQIIQGKTIGENVIIGAGAVVIDSIPSNCTAVGVPAKVIKLN